MTNKFFTIATLFLINACSVCPAPQTVEVIKYIEKPNYFTDNNTLYMKVGDKKHVREILNELREGVFNGYFEGLFTWVPNDPNIVNVFNYYLHALSPGETAVTGKKITLDSTFRIKVIVRENVFCKSIQLLETSKTMKVGDVFQAEAFAIMSDDTVNTNIIWENSDERVCSVDKNGLVEAIRTGYTKIIAAYALDPKVKGFIYVNVVK